MATISTSNGARTVTAEEIAAFQAKKAAEAAAANAPKVDTGSDPVPFTVDYDPDTGMLLVACQIDPKATYRRPWVKNENRWAHIRIASDSGYKGLPLGDTGLTVTFKVTQKASDGRPASGFQSAATVNIKK